MSTTRTSGRCLRCSKTKREGEFPAANWRKHYYICNVCDLAKRHELSAIKPDEKKALRPCLKCGRSFSTTKSVRICHNCKQTRSYINGVH